MSDEMIRVIACRVGEAPAWHEISGDRRGHLAGMQSVVGGLVERVSVDGPPGLDLWCNEEGRLLDLPLNRVLAAEPRGVPEGFEDAEAIYVEDPDEPLARPGEPGEWRIRGDFFLARTDDEGDLAPATDADMEWARSAFPDTDPPAAEWWATERARLQAAGVLVK